ncbi:PH domain-containing protein [Henriciella aquimarina]|uniref:PH domain-containing protein n=1 Tax=Henriciella aquimarina TaxID=545261 RepID=UPI00130208B8|nr:PH domain-containing protein [Henriciella aquimarina]
MRYIEKNLSEDEEVLYWGEFHWLWYARAWAALIIFGILIIGIIYFIYEMLRLKTTEFAVTSRRIVMKRGILSAHVDQLSLSSIEGADLDQGIIGRIFGFGSLEIEGRGEGEIRFPPMARPGAFLKAANNASNRHDMASVDRLAHEIEEHGHHEH